MTERIMTAFLPILLNISHKIVDAEEQIDPYDAVVGDGDCGSTLGRTARTIIKSIKDDQYFTTNTDAVRFVDIIAQIVENNMDGTLGALHAIFSDEMAAFLRNIGLTANKKQVVEQSRWVQASVEALEAL